jgi:CYTH domain-containing protein
MPSNDREIERKYLLRALPGETAAAPRVEIDQGYLPGERILERVRRVRNVGTGSSPEHTGEMSYFRTIKLGSGVERFELEEETTEHFFMTVWPLTRGRRVQKRRYTLRAGTDEWEIDEFTDRALVLAEIELDSADRPVHLPSWLATFIDREVTEDENFSNYRLSK